MRNWLIKQERESVVAYLNSGTAIRGPGTDRAKFGWLESSAMVWFTHERSNSDRTGLCVALLIPWQVRQRTTFSSRVASNLDRVPLEPLGSPSHLELQRPIALPSVLILTALLLLLVLLASRYGWRSGCGEHERRRRYPARCEREWATSRSELSCLVLRKYRRNVCFFFFCFF